MPSTLDSLVRRARRSAPVAALALAALGLSGCVVAPLPHPGGVAYGGYGGYAPYGPPAAQYEAVGVAPSPLQVWIGGGYAWDSGRYAWRPGYWANPPRPGAGWVPHRWQQGPRGWQRQGGYWR